MDNGPARQADHARRLQATGDEFGQPIEISRLHIEDFDYNVFIVIGQIDFREFFSFRIRPSNRSTCVKAARGRPSQRSAAINRQPLSSFAAHASTNTAPTRPSRSNTRIWTSAQVLAIIRLSRFLARCSHSSLSRFKSAQMYKKLCNLQPHLSAYVVKASSQAQNHLLLSTQRLCD